MKKDIIWSDEQKAIFNWFIMGRGNIMCIATAGGAKSSTITEGLNRANCYPAAYLVFNKHNQIEAEKKITNKKVTVKTYHGLGYGIMRAAYGYIKTSGYREFERIKQIAPDAPPQFIFQASRLVSYLKNTCIVPTAKEAKEAINLRDLFLIKPVIDDGWTEEKMIDIALQSIEGSLVKQKVLSFEDLIYLPVRLNLIKPTYKLLASDESQDCSLIQMEMILRLGLPNSKICIVADPCQAIYGFRGALTNGTELFKEKLKAKTYPLPISYRCPRLVVEYLKQYSPKMEAAPNAINGEIINEKTSNLPKLAKVGDVVLSRTNFPLVKTCLSLIKNGIASYVEGRDLVRTLVDIINDLKATDINSFYTNLDAWENARRPVNMTISAAKKFAIVSEQAAILRVIGNECLDVDSIKKKINNLFFDANDVRIPSVICSTVHRFKGKEVDNSFILTSSFNCGRRVLTPEEIQEERNIKFVAGSRCRKKLIHLSDD